MHIWSKGSLKNYVSPGKVENLESHYESAVFRWCLHHLSGISFNNLGFPGMR